MQIRPMLRMSLPVLLACAGPALADMERPGAAAREENPRARLEELDRRIQALEQEKQEVAKRAEEAERQAQQREEALEFQNRCKERMQEVDRQLADLAAEEAGDSPARKASRQERRKWLKEFRALLEQALAIQDLARTDKLRGFRERIDDMDNEWALVRGPQLEAAVRIEELERHAAREGTQLQKDVLVRIKALAADDAVSRRNEYDTARARRTREKTIESLVQQFWQGK